MSNGLRLLTKRDVIKGVAAHWREVYYDDKGRGDYYGQDKVTIYERLLLLDLNTCSEADVAAAIGNASWTKLECDVCGDPVDVAAVMGPERTNVCAGCTLGAVKLFIERVQEEA